LITGQTLQDGPAMQPQEPLESLHLWSEKPINDLTSNVCEAFADLALNSFTHQETLSVVEHLRSIFNDTKMSRPAAAAVCCLLRSIIEATSDAHSRSTLPVAEAISSALPNLCTRQGTDGHDMTAYLLTAMRIAAATQGCILQVAKSVIVNVPVDGLYHGGRYHSMLKRWFKEGEDFAYTVVKGAAFATDQSESKSMSSCRVNCPEIM
jgi:hypothetical protein